MRLSEIKDYAPEIEKQVALPPDRVKDLKRRVRATDMASKWASELFARFMEDAQVDQDEAWDECAQLLGFKDLEELEQQGYIMVLNGGLLQLRKDNREQPTDGRR